MLAKSGLSVGNEKRLNVLWLEERMGKGIAAVLGRRY